MSNFRIRFKKDCTALWKAGTETNIEIIKGTLNDTHVDVRFSDQSILTLNCEDFEVVHQIMYLPYGMICECKVA